MRFIEYNYAIIKILFFDDFHNASFDNRLRACLVYCTHYKGCKSINWCSKSGSCYLLNIEGTDSYDTHRADDCFGYYQVNPGK